MIDIRELTDEELEEAWALIRPAAPNGRIAAEVARRAEIRVNRMMMSAEERDSYGLTLDEITQPHDGPWYESRQTEAQFLAESGAAR